MRIGRWSGCAGSGGCMGPLTSVLSPKRGEEERDGGDRPTGGRNVRVIAATKCKPPWRPSQRAEMYGTPHLVPLPETGRGGQRLQKWRTLPRPWARGRLCGGAGRVREFDGFTIVGTGEALRRDVVDTSPCPYGLWRNGRTQGL